MVVPLQKLRVQISERKHRGNCCSFLTFQETQQLSCFDALNLPVHFLQLPQRDISGRPEAVKRAPLTLELCK